MIKALDQPLYIVERYVINDPPATYSSNISPHQHGPNVRMPKEKPWVSPRDPSLIAEVSIAFDSSGWMWPGTNLTSKMTMDGCFSGDDADSVVVMMMLMMMMMMMMMMMHDAWCMVHDASCMMHDA